MTTEQKLVIPAPKFGHAEIALQSTAPLVMHKFSAKAWPGADWSGTVGYGRYGGLGTV